MIFVCRNLTTCCFKGRFCQQMHEANKSSPVSHIVCRHCDFSVCCQSIRCKYKQYATSTCLDCGLLQCTVKGQMIINVDMQKERGCFFQPWFGINQQRKKKKRKFCKFLLTTLINMNYFLIQTYLDLCFGLFFCLFFTQNAPCFDHLLILVCFCPLVLRKSACIHTEERKRHQSFSASKLRSTFTRGTGSRV